MNILARDFTIDEPNKAWMGDITYIATFAGRMYLAVIIDLFSRKVIGWALAEHMRDDLVLEALDMAVRSRGPARGVLHHSDRGSQYASDDHVRMLERRGFIASMSRKGDCWDNAVVESFFATLKTNSATPSKAPRMRAPRSTTTSTCSTTIDVYTRALATSALLDLR